MFHEKQKQVLLSLAELERETMVPPELALRPKTFPHPFMQHRRASVRSTNLSCSAIDFEAFILNRLDVLSLLPVVFPTVKEQEQLYPNLETRPSKQGSKEKRGMQEVGVGR